MIQRPAAQFSPVGHRWSLAVATRFSPVRIVLVTGTVVAVSFGEAAALRTAEIPAAGQTACCDICRGHEGPAPLCQSEEISLFVARVSELDVAGLGARLTLDERTDGFVH
jgi:hypothetical protein